MGLHSGGKGASNVLDVARMKPEPPE